jgi:hypothetical protein
LNKLLNVDKTAELKDLKTIYRNSMKNVILINFKVMSWIKAAEEKSKQVIEAYHFR